VIATEHGHTCACVQGHNAPAVTHIDHVGSVVYYHYDCGTGPGSFRSNLLPGHRLLRTVLSGFDKRDETPFTFINTSIDCFFRILREVIVLNYKIVQVVAKVVGACCSTMAVKHSEEANLRPFNVEMGLALGLQNVQND